MAFAKGARMNGATIAEGVNVTEFRTANLRGTGTSKVLGVTTEDGTQIDARYLGNGSRFANHKCGGSNAELRR